jgi:hypothetical protein
MPRFMLSFLLASVGGRFPPRSMAANRPVTRRAFLR